MHPEFHLLIGSVSAYALCTMIALVVVMVGSYLITVRHGFLPRDVLWMLGGMGLGALIGARLLNVLVHFESYRGDLGKIFAMEATGFSLYGGVLVGMAVGLFIGRWRDLPLLRFADLMTPFVGLGIVTMRIGCFLHGCCFGKATDLPWGVTFPVLSPAHQHQISTDLLGSLIVDSVHPTQLYEGLVALCGIMIAIYLLKRRAAIGIVAVISLLWFTAFRLVLMPFREQPCDEIVLHIVYPLLYLGIIAIGIFWLLMLNRNASANKASVSVA